MYNINVICSTRCWSVIKTVLLPQDWLFSSLHIQNHWSCHCLRSLFWNAVGVFAPYFHFPQSVQQLDVCFYWGCKIRWNKVVQMPFIFRLWLHVKSILDEFWNILKDVVQSLKLPCCHEVDCFHRFISKSADHVIVWSPFSEMQFEFLSHTFTFRCEYSNHMFAFAKDLFGCCFPLSSPSIIL